MVVDTINRREDSVRTVALFRVTVLATGPVVQSDCLLSHRFHCCRSAMAQNAPVPPPVADRRANEMLDEAYDHEAGDVANPAIPVGLAQAIAQALAPIIEQQTNLDQAIAQLNTQLTNMTQTQQHNMTQALAPIIAKQNNLCAKQINSTVLNGEDELVPIQDAAGNVAPNFPTTLKAFISLSDPVIGRLLEFYDIATNPVETQYIRLRLFLGLRL